MNRIKKARWGFKIIRLAMIALTGYLLAMAFIPQTQADEMPCPILMDSQGSFVFLDCHMKTARTAGLPVTAAPQWHPDENHVGRHMVVRALVGDEIVKRECKTEAYACARMQTKLKIQTCEIYMPDFEHVAGQTGTWRGTTGTGEVLYARVPRGQKPPAEWFWLLGRETGHCLFGKYHD